MTRWSIGRYLRWLGAVLLIVSQPLTAEPARWSLGGELIGATTVFDDTPDRGQFGTGQEINGRIDGAFDFDDRRDTSAALGVRLERTQHNWTLGGVLLWHFPVDWDISAPTPSIETVTNTFTNVERASLLLTLGRSGSLGQRWRWHAAMLGGVSFQRLTSDYVERAVPGVRPENFQSEKNNGIEPAWGIELGVSRPLSQRWDWRLGYRGLATGDLSVRATQGSTATLDSALFDHQFALTLRYQLR